MKTEKPPNIVLKDMSMVNKHIWRSKLEWLSGISGQPVNKDIWQASLAKLVVEVFVQVPLAQKHKGTNQGQPLAKYKSDLTTKVFDNQLSDRIP